MSFAPPSDSLPFSWALTTSQIPQSILTAEESNCKCVELGWEEAGWGGAHLQKCLPPVENFMFCLF